MAIIIQLPSFQDTTHCSVIVVRGIFNQAGDTLLKINPLERKSWKLITPLPNLQKGTFEIEVKYKDGSSQVVPFNAIVASDSPNAKEVHGFFEVDIPVKENISSIQIRNSTSGHVFATFHEKDIPH